MPKWRWASDLKSLSNAPLWVTRAFGLALLMVVVSVGWLATLTM
jgi:hypothetical protein